MILLSPLKVTKGQVEDWAKSGLVHKIEAAVLQGHGDLVTSMGKVWNEEARNYVKNVPELIVGADQITSIHPINMNISETN